MVKIRPKKLVDLHELLKVNFFYIPVVGHAYKFIGTHEDRMQLFDELGRQAHASKHGMVSFWFAHCLCVSVSEPLAASAVLRTCFDKWPITFFMRHLLGNGSVFGEEKIWRLRRKILNPIFSSKYYDNYVKVFERNNNIMMEQLADVAGKGEVSMWKYFSSYSMDSAFDMGFGENLNAQRHPSHPFAVAFQQYFEECAVRICQPWLFSSAVYELLPAGARQERRRRVMWDFIESLIIKKKMESKEQLRKNMEHENTNVASTNGDQYKSFLDLLMEFSGGEDGYTNTELREELLMSILGATDTTATAACFTTVLLANHPGVQDRVYKEVQDILGSAERSITIEDVPRLKYLDAVVKESLRLYPPVPVVLRRCTKHVQLPSGIILPEGCEVLLNFWGVHRNPGCWGADADEFKPERFLSATPDQLAAFMPFGHGPRSCTGMRLSLASLKLSLAELTRRCRVAPAPATTDRCSRHAPLRVTFELMLKHVHGFKVRLESRL
ncbi:cytochrome P450 4C1-like [Maniola jurtina]|uniref:cytochrome P450 4C1-like n=1 Tax=Maniola jurtina TaxID=191418 RepID=UPI001E68BC8A|nr:cytochrome P450 4C1-like [Maniola jurtina]